MHGNTVDRIISGQIRLITNVKAAGIVSEKIVDLII